MKKINVKAEPHSVERQLIIHLLQFFVSPTSPAPAVSYDAHEPIEPPILRDEKKKKN